MASPVVSLELLQLTNQGIDASSIKFKNVTMQSSRWVCVRDEGKSSMCILDTATKTFVRLPVMADSAIMSPTERIIALRAGLTIQVYNLDVKTRIKTATMPGDVVYWKFVDSNTIVLVTAQHVYTWPVNGDGAPVKLFDRQPHAGVVQIINYRASADGKWHILGGITVTPSGSVTGVLQVYSSDLKASQPQMDALAACFATVIIDGRSVPSNLFCFTKQTEQGLKVMIIEVGVPKDQAFTQAGVIKLPPGDFPVGMLPDNKNGMVFVVSKMGVLALLDIHSGQCIYSSQPSSNTMFLQIESEAPEGGILTVDSTGRLHHHFVEEKGLLSHIKDTLGNPELAAAIARRRKPPAPVREQDLDFSGFADAGVPELVPAKSSDSVMDNLANRKPPSLSGPPADPFALLAESSPFSPVSIVPPPFSSPSLPPSPAQGPAPPPRASLPPVPRSPAFVPSPSTLVDFDDHSVISVDAADSDGHANSLQPQPQQQLASSPKLDGLFSIASPHPPPPQPPQPSQPQEQSPQPSQPQPQEHQSDQQQERTQQQEQPQHNPIPPPQQHQESVDIIPIPSSPLPVQNDNGNNYNENNSGDYKVEAPSHNVGSNYLTPLILTDVPSPTPVPAPSGGVGFRLSNLTVAEVSEWLRRNQLGQYAEGFAALEIDGRSLWALVLSARQSVIAVLGYLKQDLEIRVPGHALRLITLLTEEAE